MSRRNLLAVNRVISDAGLASRPEHAAVVQFARDCARRLDSVSTAEAPVTLLAEYRGALRDLRRAAKESAPITRAEKRSKPARDLVESEAVESIAGLDDLQLFMRRWRVRPEDREQSPEYAAAIAAEYEGRQVSSHAVDKCRAPDSVQ